MKKIPVALQLYSVRDECKADFGGTLRKVAEMGYEGVEFAGYHGHGADDVRRMIGEAGLACAGAHVGLRGLLDAEFDKTVEFNRKVGNRHLIVPAVPPEQFATRAAVRKTAELLNSVADRAAAAGMRIGYHNHAVEFLAVEGELPWDILCGATKASVIMQLDTGHARRAGHDPVRYIERYPGRTVTVHLKEWTDSPDGAVVGEGAINWESIFRACETVGGTEWYIVEQEVGKLAPLDCARRCRENLRKMGK